MKPLGVGLVYVPGLLPLLREGLEADSILEIEPQTLLQLSREGGQDAFHLDDARFRELRALPVPKLLHSVGLPVGGSRPPDPRQLALVGYLAAELRPAFISEHLSFNAFPRAGGWTSAGFLLPPRQDEASVRVAAANLGRLASAWDRPIAFETGVNYLRPQPDELPDGTFFRRVAEAADCGILVDLHNLWTNEYNGRARAAEVLAALPAERVWEIHVAGGLKLNGYHLDAHSGAVPEPVSALLAEWLPRFPNLAAVVFEILEEHLPALGLDGVRREVEGLRRLWRERLPAPVEIRVPSAGSTASGQDLARAGDWERLLGSLAIGGVAAGLRGWQLEQDPGIEILRTLVADARAGLVARGLKYTTTLLMATLGPADVRRLLREFWRSRPPELFAGAEADAFARFLKDRALQVPYLAQVLDFEHAVVRAVLYGHEVEVSFDHEPTALLESLDRGEVPRQLPHQPAALVVRPA